MIVIHPCEHQPAQDIEYSCRPRKFPPGPFQSPSPCTPDPTPPPRGNCYANLHQRGFVLSVLSLHINEITNYALFCGWFLSLNAMVLRYTHVVAYISCLSLLTASRYFFEQVTVLTIFFMTDIWVISRFELVMSRAPRYGHTSLYVDISTHFWEWHC